MQQTQYETDHNGRIKWQFDTRASTFERSARWITDPALLAAHVRMAGKPIGRALEVCCGTGVVGRSLKDAGWNVVGVDISDQMIREAGRYIQAQVCDVTKLPFSDGEFDLATMRQAYFLLDDGPRALDEIRRVLTQEGRFILSHLVPFSSVDAHHLRLVHSVKQAQMRQFHTVESLCAAIEDAGFTVIGQDEVVVRESVTQWMREAPELSEDTRREVCRLVAEGPESYRKLRRVELVDGEIFEDWNFVLLEATPK